MADVTLNATLRTLRGKKVRALRREGLVPANIYGAEERYPGQGQSIEPDGEARSQPGVLSH
jgi:ribosomal protein L25 (general stress protein Ctc)